MKNKILICLVKFEDKLRMRLALGEQILKEHEKEINEDIKSPK